MAETKVAERRDLDHADKRDHVEKRDDKKEDMTPVPTQAELDEVKGGKDHKVEKREAKTDKQEDLTPTPTQEEANEQKAALYGTTIENEQKLREAEKKQRESLVARDAKDTKDAPEDLTPTPTQAELDEVKKDVMYEPEDNPGGGTDPQRKEADAKRRSLEAEKPGGPGYQTRAGAREPAREPAHAHTPAHTPEHPRAKE